MNAGSIPDGKNFTIRLEQVAADTNIAKVAIYVPAHGTDPGKGFEVADPTFEVATPAKRKNKASNQLEINYVNAEFTTALDATNSVLRTNTLRFGASTTHTGGTPVVYSMMRPGSVVLPVAYDKNATFDVVVTISEEPKTDTFTKDRFFGLRSRHHGRYASHSGWTKSLDETATGSYRHALYGS